MSPAGRTRRRGALPAWVVGSGVIAVAMAVMNVSTYGFTIVAARLLGPAEYGALAAIMGLLMVVNVVSLGLQATGARRVSAAPEDLAQIEAEVLSTTTRAALVLGLLALVASPLIAAVLELDSWAPAALIAVAAVPLTVMGGQGGILQGERRWVPLALIYLSMGLGRLVFGVAAMVLEPHTLGAMAGITLGAFVPMVVGWYAMRHPSRAGRSAPAAARPQAGRRRWSAGSVLHETMHNSHALLAFFALSNADVVIARTVLPEHPAGLYAGGLILAKAVLFLPQFIVVIAFPSMSKQPSSRRMHLSSLGLVLAIGAATVLGTALLSGLAVTFIGGREYAELQEMLWGFAALGTLLAMLQLMVYGVVARQHQRMVFVIWGALALLVATAPVVHSTGGLLRIVVAIDAALFVVLLLVSLRKAPVEEGVTAGPAPVA
jgi:O-antigen/teichoic acid export membrane protein